MGEDQPDLMPGERADLADLRWNWPDAYTIDFTPPSQWSARRTDNDQLIEATSADELRRKIRADYWAQPVRT